MITVDIDVTGLKEAFIKMQTLPEKVNKIMFNTSYRIGSRIKDTASWYAPKSPTQQELTTEGTSRMRALGWSKKRINNVRKAAKKRRKATAYTRSMPGALQSSIMCRSDADGAVIFVPSNSPAGPYAVKIHDEKGKTWWKRGIGTIAKGQQADEKFIERAVHHHIDNGDIERVIDDSVQKILKG